MIIDCAVVVNFQIVFTIKTLFNENISSFIDFTC